MTTAFASCGGGSRGPLQLRRARCAARARHRAGHDGRHIGGSAQFRLHGRAGAGARDDPAVDGCLAQRDARCGLSRQPVHRSLWPPDRRAGSSVPYRGDAEADRRPPAAGRHHLRTTGISLLPDRNRELLSIRRYGNPRLHPDRIWRVF